MKSEGFFTYKALSKLSNDFLTLLYTRLYKPHEQAANPLINASIDLDLNNVL